MNEIKKLTKLLEDIDKKKTKALDTQGVVKRVEGKTAWVRFNGGVDETPVRMTISCKQGDTVNVRSAGGYAWITGNDTDPPTGDAMATKAFDLAELAKLLAEYAQVTANEGVEASKENAEAMALAVLNLNADIADLQSQIDGEFDTWFYAGEPSLNSPPVTYDGTNPDTGWDTVAKKNEHIGDLYFDTVTGYSYRFMSDGAASPTFSWLEVSDSAATEALRIASEAQDTADSKRRVFVAKPIIPDVAPNGYDVGDLWVQGANGDILRCATAKTSSGTYSDNDWIKASKYTDDYKANQAYELAESCVIETWTEYNMSTRSDQFSQATGYSWSTTIPTYVAGLYIWRRTGYRYANNTVDYDTPRLSTQDQALGEVQAAEASTNNHFWSDGSGAYVTQNDHSYSTGYATKTTAQGILQLLNNKKLSAWTGSGLTFFKYDPNNAQNEQTDWLVTYGSNGTEFNPLYPFQIGNANSYIKWEQVSGAYKINIKADSVLIGSASAATTGYVDIAKAAAEKEATSYLSYDANGGGVTIGYSGLNSKVNIKNDGIRLYDENGDLGNHVKSDGVHLYKGGTEVSSFGDETIALGKNSRSSKIQFCNNASEINVKIDDQNPSSYANDVRLKCNIPIDTSLSKDYQVSVGFLTSNGDSDAHTSYVKSLRTYYYSTNTYYYHSEMGAVYDDDAISGGTDCSAYVYVDTGKYYTQVKLEAKSRRGGLGPSAHSEEASIHLIADELDKKARVRVNAHDSVEITANSYREISIGDMTARAKEIDSSLGTSSTDDAWLTAILKAICDDYPYEEVTVFKGRYCSVSHAFFEVCIYNTSTVNSSGMPQYCHGWARRWQNNFFVFSTNNYTFSKTTVV